MNYKLTIKKYTLSPRKKMIIHNISQRQTPARCTLGHRLLGSHGTTGYLYSRKKVNFPNITSVCGAYTAESRGINKNTIIIYFRCKYEFIHIICMGMCAFRYQLNTLRLFSLMIASLLLFQRKLRKLK